MSLFERLKRALRSVAEYVDTAADAVRDGNLSPDELQELHKIAAKLGMTIEERQRAHAKVVEKLMATSMADGYLDEPEIDILNRAMQDLRVDPAQLDPVAHHALLRMLQLQQVIAGQLPQIHPTQAPLALSQGEVAHLVTPCRIEQERVVRRRNVGGYSGVSLRIARGVHYHIGGSRGSSYPVTQQVTVSHGNLVLSSKRAVYLGSTRGFNKPWAKVSAVEPYSNAVTFYFTDRQNATTLLYEDPSVAPFVEGVVAYFLR